MLVPGCDGCRGLLVHAGLSCLVVVVASLWGAAAPHTPRTTWLPALGVVCMGLPALGVT